MLLFLSRQQGAFSSVGSMETIHFVQLLFPHDDMVVPFPDSSFCFEIICNALHL